MEKVQKEGRMKRKNIKIIILITSSFTLFLRRNGHLWDYLQTFTDCFLSQTT